MWCLRENERFRTHGVLQQEQNYVSQHALSCSFQCFSGLFLSRVLYSTSSITIWLLLPFQMFHIWLALLHQEKKIGICVWSKVTQSRTFLSQKKTPKLVDLSRKIFSVWCLSVSFFFLQSRLGLGRAANVKITLLWLLLPVIFTCVSFFLICCCSRFASSCTHCLHVLQRQLQPLPNHHHHHHHQHHGKQRGAGRGSSTPPTTLYPPPPATATTFPAAADACSSSEGASSPRGRGSGGLPPHLSKPGKSRSVVDKRSEGAQMDKGAWLPPAGVRRQAIDLRGLKESNLWKAKPESPKPRRSDANGNQKCVKT